MIFQNLSLDGRHIRGPWARMTLDVLTPARSNSLRARFSRARFSQARFSQARMDQARTRLSGGNIMVASLDGR